MRNCPVFELLSLQCRSSQLEEERERRGNEIESIKEIEKREK